jgi:hypothetical protein
MRAEGGHGETDRKQQQVCAQHVNDTRDATSAGGILNGRGHPFYPCIHQLAFGSPGFLTRVWSGRALYELERLREECHGMIWVSILDLLFASLISPMYAINWLPGVYMRLCRNAGMEKKEKKRGKRSPTPEPPVGYSNSLPFVDTTPSVRAAQPCCLPRPKDARLIPSNT